MDRNEEWKEDVTPEEEVVDVTVETEEEPREEVMEGQDDESMQGDIRIADDVIAQLAMKALDGVEGVQAASPGFGAKLGLGRKATGGVRISLSEGEQPVITVDTYLNVKYGLRIPDVGWDVQEAIKEQLEEFTGYPVKAVNVFVQGVYFGEGKAPVLPEGEEAAGGAVETESPEEEEPAVATEEETETPSEEAEGKA